MYSSLQRLSIQNDKPHPCNQEAVKLVEWQRGSWLVNEEPAPSLFNPGILSYFYTFGARSLPRCPSRSPTRSIHSAPGAGGVRPRKVRKYAHKFPLDAPGLAGPPARPRNCLCLSELAITTGWGISFKSRQIQTAAWVVSWRAHFTLAHPLYIHPTLLCRGRNNTVSRMAGRG